jgi:hypothetical protein
VLVRKFRMRSKALLHRYNHGPHTCILSIITLKVGQEQDDDRGQRRKFMQLRHVLGYSSTSLQSGKLMARTDLDSWAACS